MLEIFVTATDTDAGKTYASQLIVHQFNQLKQKVAVFKPISAGCSWQEGCLVNEDAELLRLQANCDQSLNEINPIAYEQPIAPHIAANLLGQSISNEDISRHYQEIKSNNSQVILTEGAGGWRLPLGNGEFLSGFVQAQQLKVILVVNMKLGCLNHAVLTYESIKKDGLTCVGWLANCIEPMPYQKENIEELKQIFSAPLLGCLDYELDITKAAQKLDTKKLLSLC